MKLIIRPSNLSLRFYIKDHWSIDLINSFFEEVTILCPFLDDQDPYYVIDHEKTIIANKKKILKECYIQPNWVWTAEERNRTQAEILDSYLK